MPVEPKRSSTGLCSDAMRERDYRKHCERMAKQRSLIDNSTPASCAYTRPVRDLNRPSGRAAVRDRRSEQIEYDNQRLVERMVYIMQNGGGIDNKEPWRQPQKAANASAYRRNAEQERIYQENAKLLQRLEGTKSTYRVEKLEADRSRNEELAARISHYPYQPMDRSGAPTRSRTDVQY